jgi:hypothetical protein
VVSKSKTAKQKCIKSGALQKAFKFYSFTYFPFIPAAIPGGIATNGTNYNQDQQKVPHSGKFNGLSLREALAQIAQINKAAAAQNITNIVDCF